MGATLRYAKVVDRDYLQEHGGISPRIDNKVVLSEDPPAVARDFMILRAWKDVGSGGLEETWRLEDPHGRVIYNGVPRTVLADHDDLYDEVQGVRFEHSDTSQLVLEVDGREVARADFEVSIASQV
jgi:hypothetical protein